MILGMFYVLATADMRTYGGNVADVEVDVERLVLLVPGSLPGQLRHVARQVDALHADPELPRHVEVAAANPVADIEDKLACDWPERQSALTIASLHKRGKESRFA
jgi:hypothetical protein